MTARWFAVVDTAADESLWPLVQGCERRACLILGELHPVMAAVAPYLVAVDEAEPLLAAWQERGTGQHWGILCEAELPLEDLRRHFRRFLQVKLPDGTIAQFRFYDPRVFSAYLPAAPAEQQAAWFDGVRRYAVESESGGQRSFRLRSGRLFDGDRLVTA